MEALQSEGFSVWWDEQIGGGSAWRQAIETELNAAKCVIVVWSNRSTGPDGGFVQDEATRAQQRHVYVPVLIDKVHLPLGFGETQALPLNGWRGDRSDARYQAVLAAVRRNVGGKRKSASFPLPRTNVDRRTVVMGGSVAAVAVALVGGWALQRSSSAGESHSIAVLPFENLSGNPKDGYFADGVAEELRSALSRLGGVTVIGRTSSEAVRNDDARTAARKLGVSTILTGSVRQSTSTIRISAELVDGRTGADRWSQDYDRAPGDAIKIQTDIAQNVAAALSATLGVAARNAIKVGGTQNAGAQDLYLRADPSQIDETSVGVQRAVNDLNQAIQLDPNYASAYARKARTLGFFAAVYSKSPAQSAQLLNESTAAAEKAIELAPTLAEAHSALAYIYRQQLKFQNGLRESEIAVELPGANAAMSGNYATALVESGRADQAIRMATRAVALDPLNPGAFESQAFVFFLAHRFDAAAAAAQHALELAPARAYSRSLLAYALIMLHRYDEASMQLSRLPPDDGHGLMSRSVIAAHAGDKNTSDQVLAELRTRYGEAANYQYAEVYAQRGDRDAAIDALSKAVTMRDPGLAALKVDPFLDPLRADPRFIDIIRRLNFPG